MSMGNARYNWEALNMLDFLFEANLWHSPTSGAADILLPVCHWTEINAFRIAQGSGGSFSLCIKAVDPPGECKSDPLYFMELSKYFGVPAFDGDDPWLEKSGKDMEIENLTIQCCQQGCAPFDTWEELAAAYQEHGTWNMKKEIPQDWGTYRRFEVGQAYRKAPHQQPAQLDINIPGFPTPTMK